MRFSIVTLVVVTLVLSLLTSYTEITSQDQFFNNLQQEDYILAVFYNSKTSSHLTQPLTSILKTLNQSTTFVDNKVLVELVDTHKQPFFDSHYDLNGKSAIRLFIRNQTVKMPDIEKMLETQDKNINEQSITALLESYTSRRLQDISIEVRNIDEFRMLVLDHKTIGFYSGNRGISFENYISIAKNNIDFTFAHTFDIELRNAIYAEFGQKPAPKEDTFAIVRLSLILDDLDDQSLVDINALDEKSLTEFLEFERFEKLRGSEHGSDIFRRVFSKTQALVVYIQGEDKDSVKFKAYREALKFLPKKLIYSYTDIDSAAAGPYVNLFMAAKRIVEQDTLSIIWTTPLRQVIVVTYAENFSVESIVNFIKRFIEENTELFSSMRAHMYDSKEGKTERVTSEEL